MICYKDMTFCSYYKVCKKGFGCRRALTKEVVKRAEEWHGNTNPPISQFLETPECFERIEE